MRPRPKNYYPNVAAKYFYVKSVQARRWRKSIRSGIITPPPPLNPYITKEDIRYYRYLVSKRSSSSRTSYASYGYAAVVSYEEVYAKVKEDITKSVLAGVILRLALIHMSRNEKDNAELILEVAKQWSLI